MVMDCLPCLRKHNSTEPVGNPIDLYYYDISPPSRAVLMTAREIGINLNPIKLDLMAGEHMKAEFIKINFMHTVPTIVDDEFTLWESRPIMLYFCNKYAQNDRLYPCDPQKRALVDRMLYFDLGTLYNSIYSLIIPKLFGKVTEVDTDKEEKLREALVYLEQFIGDNKYVTGDSLTLADISILAGLTFLEVIDYKIQGFEKVQNWLQRLESELPYYNEINKKPIEDFKAARS